MDKVVLGQRITQARESAGMTQAELGAKVGIDRSAVSRLEKAERKLNVSELIEIAAALARPLAFFVSDPVPSVTSRRRNPDTSHASSTTLDIELESLAGDIHSLVEQGVVRVGERPAGGHTPKSHQAAERYAESLRQQLGLGTGPLDDLVAISEQLGLVVFASALGVDGPDGGCVDVTGAAAGVAVINGDAAPGRRRMTLAHELGHWLFGDAYDAEASLSSEEMINSFAIHFLAPRSGVISLWNEQTTSSTRDRALAVAATFKLSWSAAIGKLRNLGLIDHDERHRLADLEPRRGDYVRLGLQWAEELRSPTLSPGFSAAVVNAYVSGQLSEYRALEILRGTLNGRDLPQRADITLDDLRPAFAGHGW